jgi:hypothetical protein
VTSPPTSAKPPASPAKPQPSFVASSARAPSEAAELAEETLGAEGDAARAISHAEARNPTHHHADQGAAEHGAQNSVPRETVAVNGYAQRPGLTWAKNADGAVRTIDEAIEIARRNGVEIPDDVLFKKVNGKFLPDSTYARYFAHRGMDPKKRIRWADFYDRDLDELLVHVEDSVFKSDETIVAILAHEMHEINSLRKLFEEAGESMTARDLYYLINPGIKGNLHDRAWEIADELVSNMRMRIKPNKSQ